ncbi:MAG: hypothetical protein AB7P07_11240 [Hyphomonadaceae bacterium]
MLDLLFVAFFQAAAGEPAAQPPAEPAPQVTVQPPVEEPQAEDDEANERPVCRTQNFSGSRLGVRRCSSRSQAEREAREARRETDIIQRPSPLSGS